MLTTEFQLPLYLYAARASGNSKALRAAWLSLSDGESVELAEVLEQGQVTLDELLATSTEDRRRLKNEDRKNLANAVHGLVSGLREGKFPVRPEDCRFCSYRAVCRISERRFQEAADG